MRELKNTVARASALYRYQEVNEEHISSIINNSSNYDDHLESGYFSSDMPPLKQIERQLIIEKLKKYRGNQKRTAEELKIPASTLNDRIKNYQINVKQFRV